MGDDARSIGATTDQRENFLASFRSHDGSFASTNRLDMSEMISHHVTKHRGVGNHHRFGMHMSIGHITTENMMVSQIDPW